jgi:hypothetical protein
MSCASRENNWRITGATGAAEGLCASRKDPLKGAFFDEWRTPLGPEADWRKKGRL